MKLFKQALGALALAIAAAAHAQEPAAPDGRAILDHAATFAKDQQALAFNVKITSHVESQGTQNDAELNIEVLLQGDNHGRMRSYTSDDEAIIYSDGQERYVHLVKKEQYVKGAAVPNRREMLAMAGAGPIRMATAWIGEFITRFPDLLGKLETAEATAPGQLKLHYPSYEVDLHLGPENEPLPQRIVIDFAKSLQQQPAAIQKMTVTAEFTGWSTAPEITPDAFSWRPPDGMQAYAPQQRPQGGEAPQLGAPAPGFTLTLFSGGQVKLSDHKDKDIILLDFFASWCGPCRVAMPVVHEVAEEYKDKGVKLYAVNVREPKDKIQKFLDSAELGDIPILLDSNGRVAMDYGATSIPRMILIGKDGTVQAIHAGYSPYLKQQLKENLDTLLKGEKLAPAPGA